MNRSGITASIVVLCHNDFNYFLEALRSVFLNTSLPYELILVDNATRDAGGPFLRALDKLRGEEQRWGLLSKKTGLGAQKPAPKDLVRVKVIRNPRNKFFAAGNNQGIRSAEGRNVVLLNADALVGPGWLPGFLECLRRHPKAGLVGPCTNRSVGWQHVRDVLPMGMKDFFKFSRRWMRSRRGRSHLVHRLAAFCWLLPRSTLEAVGVLDARFGPGGYEDWDYCMRLKMAGYDIVLAEDVFVYHHGGRGYVNMDYRGMLYRNRGILIDKYSAGMRRGAPDLRAFCVT